MSPTAAAGTSNVWSDWEPLRLNGDFSSLAQDGSGSSITIRTEDIITKVKNLNKIIAWSDSAVSSSSEGGGAALASGSDLARLEEELLTMLGPVGRHRP